VPTPTKEISVMSLPECGQVCKRGREWPPHRRQAATSSFEHGGVNFTMTEGCYNDGRPCELFMNAAHANSALDAIISDAAIAVSFALQHGCNLDDIRRAMKRTGSGEPSSPIGAALDRIIP
jgi:hypothetical protein